MRSMFDYMEMAPKAALQIIEDQEKLINPLVDLFLAGKYKKIVIVASGSSYNIACSIRYQMQDLLQVEVKVVWPLTYLHFDNKWDDEALILMMSQSGRSTNTIEAAKKARSLEREVAILTTNASAKASDFVEHVFEYGSGTDDYYVAKGYICSSVYLLLFAVKVAIASQFLTEKDGEVAIRTLKKAIQTLKSTREASIDFFEKNKQIFLASRRIMIIGAGSGYGVALEGALKINEMVGTATNAYELEEFIHGPSYEVRKNHLLIFIDDNKATSERLNQIYNASKILTDRIIRLSNYRDPESDLEMKIPASKLPDFHILNNIIPFQTFSESICSELDLLNYNLTNYDFEQLVKNKA